MDVCHNVWEVERDMSNIDRLANVHTLYDVVRRHNRLMCLDLCAR